MVKCSRCGKYARKTGCVRCPPPPVSVHTNQVRFDSNTTVTEPWVASEEELSAYTLGGCVLLAETIVRELQDRGVEGHVVLVGRHAGDWHHVAVRVNENYLDVHGIWAENELVEEWDDVVGDSGAKVVNAPAGFFDVGGEGRWHVDSVWEQPSFLPPVEQTAAGVVSQLEHS